MEYVTRNVVWKMHEVIFTISVGKVSADIMSLLLNSALQERCTLSGESLEVN